MKGFLDLTLVAFILKADILTCSADPFCNRHFQCSPIVEHPLALLILVIGECVLIVRSVHAYLVLLQPLKQVSDN